MANNPRSTTGGWFGNPQPPQPPVETEPYNEDWIFQRVTPRTAVFVDAADFLQPNVTAVSNNLAFTLYARLLLADGTIQQIQTSWIYTGNGSGQAFKIYLAEGWLIGMTVVMTTANVGFGDAFMQVFLSRNSGDAETGSMLLIADYANSDYALAWPGNVLKNTDYGPGRPLGIVGSVPAAGAAAFLPFDLHLRRKILAVSVGLTTAVAVATRELWLAVTVDNVNFMKIYAGQTQAASLTYLYTFAPGLNNALIGASAVTAGFPEDFQTSVWAQGAVNCGVDGIQAADQLTAITVIARTWHESD